MIEVNLEQFISLVALATSIITGRISIVFMRGPQGFVEDILSTCFGLAANFVWVGCLVWFYLHDFWILPLFTAFFAIFVLNKFILPQRIIIWKSRNIVRVVAICTGVFIWKSHLGF